MSVIDFPTSPQTLHNELTDLLARQRKSTGAQALKALLSQPGIALSAIELSLAVDWGIQRSETLCDLLYPAWGNVPVCDFKAISAYRLRLNQLEKLKAQRREKDLTADTSELDWEADFLRAELRNSTQGSGRIVNFRQSKKQAYNRLRLALISFLNSVENPLLSRYISQNLKTGRTFVWLGNEHDAIEIDKELPMSA